MTEDLGAAAFRPIRHQFPITAARAYLFAGGMAPLSSASRAAVEAYSALWASDPVSAYRSHPREQTEALRADIAAIIGARADDVAIVDSTSRGNNLAVQMLAAPAGSNVVVDATTYPTALYPWLLRDGVEIRRVRSIDGLPSLSEFGSLVDEHTAAVSVSHVCRLTGFRHDLRPLAEIAHAAGAALVVDAAQSIGVVPIEVQEAGVDFLSFGAMKWLLGTPGIAFFYVQPELQERLSPPHVGGSAAVEQRKLVLPAGGVRHELSSINWLGVEASRRGLALLTSMPREAVERRVLELSGNVIEGLLQRGAVVRTPREAGRRAGIVAFANGAPVALSRFLRERDVDIWGWERQQLVRVDPHVYNNEQDIERFFDAYDAFRNLSDN